MLTSEPANILASQYFGRQLVDAKGYAKEFGSYCYAPRYYVDIATPLIASIRGANDAAFTSVADSQQPTSPSPDAELHIRFEVEDGRASIGFEPSLRTGTIARGYVELVLEVTVYDSSGKPVFQKFVEGVGHGTSTEGDCGERGSGALGRATEEAIRLIVSEYVVQVINAPEMESFRGQSH